MEPMVVDTAVSVPGRGLYVFSGDQLWRYSGWGRAPDPGYPKRITAEFPGTFPRGVNAALVHPDGSLYLFRGDQHIRYNLAAGRPDLGYPRPYAPDWPGVFPARIDAAITWAPDIIYLFSGGAYTSFSPRRGHARPGFPKAIADNWPGLRSSPVLAALVLPDDRRALITGGQTQAYDGCGHALEGEVRGLPIAVPARLRIANEVTDQRSAVQRGLDEFLNRMIAVYRALDGTMAAVPPPFVMCHYDKAAGICKGWPAQQDKAKEAPHKAHVASVMKNKRIAQVIWLVQEGRGSPEQIRLVTQALIDDSALDEYTGALDKRIRQMMFDYMIGSDCAGYVQQAYLSATGIGRGAAHFRDIGNEDLGDSAPDLARRGFMRIDDPPAAMPGDLVVLDVVPPDRPPGHRAIVYSRHEATDAEKQELANKFPSPLSVPAGASVYVLELDSSWGNSGLAQQGGVQRRTFWYNPGGTPKWVWTYMTDGMNSWSSGDQPYNHRLRGFYRLK
jgi:hypothetical protein